VDDSRCGRITKLSGLRARRCHLRTSPPCWRRPAARNSAAGAN